MACAQAVFYTQRLPVEAAAETPFHGAEEAWFWVMRWYQASQDGARFRAGRSDHPRPCEPVDVLRAVDRLYRNRRLQRDHLAVLCHYGRKDTAPSPRINGEYRASVLWAEAMERLDAALRKKGIVA